MLTSKLSPPLRARSVILTLALLLFSIFAVAQSSRPLGPGKKGAAQTVKLLFEEDGRLISSDGFAILETVDYQLNIEAKASAKQHTELLKFFTGQLNKTLEGLRDEKSDSYESYYRLLGADKFADFVREYEELVKIMELKDATKIIEGLNSSANAFPHFLGKDKLCELLFGNVHRGVLSVGGQEFAINGNYNGPFRHTVKASRYPIDKLGIVLAVDSMKQGFLSGYFNAAKEQSKFGYPDPKVFYGRAKRQIDTIFYFQKKSLEKLGDYNAGTVLPFCEPGFTDSLKRMEDLYATNPMIMALKSEWTLLTAWMTGGKLKLNPLTFTDPELLAYKEGYNELLAKRFDDYTDKSLNRMLDPASKLPINPSEFDSLNKVAGTGSKLYDYKKENEELKKKNSAAMAKALGYRTVQDSLTFKVLPVEDEDSYFMRIYNAAERKLSLGTLDVPVLYTTMRVEAMAYNIRADQTFSLTPVVNATAESSAAAQGVGEATGLLASAITNGASGFASWLPILQQFQNKQMDLKPVVVIPKSGTKMRGDEATLHLGGFSKGKMELYSLDEQGNKFDELDIWKHILKKLEDTHLDNCGEFTVRVKERLKKELEFSDDKKYGPGILMIKRDNVLYKLMEVAGKIIAEELKKELGKRYNEIDVAFNIAPMAKYLYDKEGYQLPPREVKPGKPVAPAAYYNQYATLEAQTEAKKVVFPFTVSGKKDKATVTREDRFRVTPPRWVTASLGFAWLTEPFRRNEVTTGTAGISNEPDEHRLRLAVGINLYPVPARLADDRFIFSLSGRELASRFSFFLGTSFPKPLYNPKVGIGVEPWTGIHVVGGLHFYRRTTYQVMNDQLVDERSRYVYNSPFVSLALEPSVLLKLLQLKL